MRIEINTTNPAKLKADILQKAEEDEPRTWEVRTYSSENFLTHKGQWEDDALLKFTIKINENQLVVTITYLTGKEKPSEYTKGIYLGRFSEALLNHFGNSFSSFETFFK